MRISPFFILSVCTIFSCSIVDEESLTDLPSEGRVKQFELSSYVNSEVTTGTMSFEGSFANPSKITITWAGDPGVNRIPVADLEPKTTSTTYELTNFRVTAISNFAGSKLIRHEKITYANNGAISNVVQTNLFEDGTVFYEINNDFYWSGRLDSIGQRVEFYDDNVWEGFIVSLANRNSSSTISSCDGSTLGSANYMGIMPFEEGGKYQLQTGIGQYFNEETNQYEVSGNDFRKSYFTFEYNGVNQDFDGDSEESGGVFSQVQFFGETSADCDFLNASSGWTIYPDEETVMKNIQTVNYHFTGYGQVLTPMYYYVLTRPIDPAFPFRPNLLIPEADILSILNRKVEAGYVMPLRDKLPNPDANLDMQRDNRVYEFSK